MSNKQITLSIKLDKDIHKWLENKALNEGDGADVAIAIINCIKMVKNGIGINSSDYPSPLETELQKMLCMVNQSAMETLLIVRNQFVPNQEIKRAFGVKANKLLRMLFPLLGEKYFTKREAKEKVE